MSDLDKYRHTTSDLAKGLKVNKKTIYSRTKALGLGIDLGGSAGFRYSDDDVDKLIAALRPPAPTPRTRRRRNPKQAVA